MLNAIPSSFFRNRQLVAHIEVNSHGQYHQMTRHHQGKFLLKKKANGCMYLSHEAHGNSYNKLYGVNDSVK